MNWITAYSAARTFYPTIASSHTVAKLIGSQPSFPQSNATEQHTTNMDFIVIRYTKTVASCLCRKSRLDLITAMSEQAAPSGGLPASLGSLRSTATQMLEDMEVQEDIIDRQVLHNQNLWKDRLAWSMAKNKVNKSALKWWPREFHCHTEGSDLYHPGSSSFHSISTQFLVHCKIDGHYASWYKDWHVSSVTDVKYNLGPGDLLPGFALPGRT